MPPCYEQFCRKEAGDLGALHAELGEQFVSCQQTLVKEQDSTAMAHHLPIVDEADAHAAVAVVVNINGLFPDEQVTGEMSWERL